ncbi:hypothetical protein DSLASN_11770 [Desulfoluna limicola]|uniref:Uncharacterized protein n=1 Tax=Desulfoluna limicola TaxID=2810562 RepID=A0ABN6F206_9BACT|nr:hypothetical protein DSLASN_11770 [Desulfoluna limicola]
MFPHDGGQPKEVSRPVALHNLYASGGSLFEKSSAKTFLLLRYLLDGTGYTNTDCALISSPKTCLSNFSKVWPPAGPPEATSC